MSSGVAIPKPTPRERLKRWQHARKPINKKGAVSLRYDAVRQEFIAELAPHMRRCVKCRRPCSAWQDAGGYWHLTDGFHVHHFAKRSKFPELREDKKNFGILCKDCHRGEHPL